MVFLILTIKQDGWKKSMAEARRFRVGEAERKDELPRRTQT
jgi:hypothetical protein